MQIIKFIFATLLSICGVTAFADTAVGTASSGEVSAHQPQTRPLARDVDLIEAVPGVVATATDSAGRPSQVFTRGAGFSTGNGLSVWLQGVPLQSPVSLYGDNSLDFSLVIPEFVTSLQYAKGGFNAARLGGQELDAQLSYGTPVGPFASAALGSQGKRRVVVGTSTKVAKATVTLGAAQDKDNGPWVTPADFEKTNAFVTIRRTDDSQSWSLTAMGAEAAWNGIGFMPARANLPRFASLDSSVGGYAQRYSLSGDFQKQTGENLVKGSAFALRSNTTDFSNRTYFLRNPVEGDQVAQFEQRSTYGMSLSRATEWKLAGMAATTEVGIQARSDQATLASQGSRARAVYGSIRSDKVTVESTSVYAQQLLQVNQKVRVSAGVRADRLASMIATKGGPTNRSHLAQVSPTAGIAFQATPRTEVFANAGRGLMIDDVRAMSNRQDLARITNSQEVGIRTQPNDSMTATVTLWGAKAEQGVSYNPATGRAEVSPATRRGGLELTNEIKFNRLATLHVDVAAARARQANGQLVAGSVDRMAAVGISVGKNGWTGMLQAQHVGARVLSADDGVMSRPVTTANLRVARSLGENAEIAVTVNNLTDVKTPESERYGVSRLIGESSSRADRMMLASEPRTVRLSLSMKF